MAEGMTPREAHDQSGEHISEYNELQGSIDDTKERVSAAEEKLFPESGRVELDQQQKDWEAKGIIAGRKSIEASEQAKQDILVDARTAVEDNSGAYHDAARIDAQLDGVEIKTEDYESN